MVVPEIIVAIPDAGDVQPARNPVGEKGITMIARSMIGQTMIVGLGGFLDRHPYQALQSHLWIKDVGIDQKMIGIKGEKGNHQQVRILKHEVRSRRTREVVKEHKAVAGVEIEARLFEAGI